MVRQAPFRIRTATRARRAEKADQSRLRGEALAGRRLRAGSRELQEADLSFSESDYRAALRTLSVSLRVDALPEDLRDRFRTTLHRRMRGELSLSTWLTAIRAIREWHEAQGPSRAELEARWRKASRGWGSAGPQGW
jgi:hypothetical protein